MGSGRWSTNVYDAAARFRAATGASAFAYSDGGATRVHPTLDPFGVTARAFRAGHPDAVALRYAAEVAGRLDGVALTHLDVAARHRLRLCRAYLADGQLVSRIEPGPERDLSWQERLTDRLLRARPVYEDAVSDHPAGGAPAGSAPAAGAPAGTEPAGDWPGIFEDILGAPVVLRSYGPTAAAKRGRQAAPALPGRTGSTATAAAACPG